MTREDKLDAVARDLLDEQHLDTITGRSATRPDPTRWRKPKSGGYAARPTDQPKPPPPTGPGSGSTVCADFDRLGDCVNTECWMNRPRQETVVTDFTQHHEPEDGRVHAGGFCYRDADYKPPINDERPRRGEGAAVTTPEGAVRCGEVPSVPPCGCPDQQEVTPGVYVPDHLDECDEGRGTSPWVCPRCSNGRPICTDRKPDGSRYSHAKTCATYRWANEVCSPCLRAMTEEEKDDA